MYAGGVGVPLSHTRMHFLYCIAYKAFNMVLLWHCYESHDIISCVQTFFLHKAIFNKMFHSDYKHIIDRLLESLVKRACQRLLHHSKDPILLESISEKSE